MMTIEQITTVLSKRQLVQPSSVLAEVALLNEIRATLAETDPLHSKIEALFGSESEADPIWNQRYNQVLSQARRRLV